MTEFVKQDFSGARFEQVDFSRAWFRNVYFTGATVRGAWLEDVDIDGEIRNVRINGVDIVPLVEAELNRRYPERTKLDPADADGFREAWAIIEQAWPPTVERAKSVPNDPDARPSLDEVLELRADRLRTVHDVIATLTDDVGGGETDPVPSPGYPPAGSYSVSRCLRAIVNEEWLHRLYAERDLAVLEQRGRLNPPRPAAAAAHPGEPRPTAISGQADSRC